jgi:hypothetical protein
MCDSITRLAARKRSPSRNAVAEGVVPRESLLMPLAASASRCGADLSDAGVSMNDDLRSSDLA